MAASGSPALKAWWVIDPARIPTNSIAPPVHIDSVRANGQEVARGEDIIVPPGDGEVEFSFDALSFIAPQKVHFRYRLDGFDKDWVEAGNRRMAFYTNLEPDRYTFRVIAANADGLWNESGDSLGFELLPHFYQTVWFYVLSGGLLCAGLAGIYGWRVQHLKHNQLVLHAEVKNRTAELAKTNTSLYHEIEERKGAEVQLKQRTHALENEIKERKLMELEIARIHQELVDASRRAGMAEIATNVLHNVGNVLNSVNVSAGLVVMLAAKALQAGQPYALAFVDVRMPPGWDGVETTRKIWEIDPDVQIVICTAYSDYSWGEMFAQLGQRDGLLILKKPFDAVEAFQMAHALTEKWSLHLMGPDVNVRLVPADSLHAVRADAGQIEQVIMNMVLNARDAMPSGGKLLLETANVSFDEGSVDIFPELKPDDYVMLAITDTGAGMSGEVKAHLFEPFFTTKGVGQGTGLGLSTCYGIIRQSGGHISVDSEAGQGATFRIYLPQVEAVPKTPLRRLDSPDLPRGVETILLVEDDTALLEMSATFLRRLGYTVLASANGLEALNLKQQSDNRQIDLLFTDVTLPHMSGRDLADRARKLHPNIRILFTSAHTETAPIHQSLLDDGAALLQRPFTPSDLAQKVRDVLDQIR